MYCQNGMDWLVFPPFAEPPEEVMEFFHGPLNEVEQLIWVEYEGVIDGYLVQMDEDTINDAPAIVCVHRWREKGHPWLEVGEEIPQFFMVRSLALDHHITRRGTAFDGSAGLGDTIVFHTNKQEVIFTTMWE